MRRKKAIMVNVFDAFGSRYDSYISHYEIINIPRFKHKKKPISMFKALEVRDIIERNRHLSQNIMHVSVGGEAKIINGLTAVNLGEIK